MTSARWGRDIGYPFLAFRAVLAPECGISVAAQQRRAIELDLRGLKCPLPVLRTRKALRHLVAGDVAIVLCTDPLAVIDIPHLVRSEGHRLDGQSEADGVTTFRITKGRREPAE